MPLVNKATLVVGAGNFYRAPVGTSFPSDLRAPEAAWVNIGHTSLEDILSFDSEGGEPTVLGTLQAPSLRTTYSKRTDSFSIVLQQFDEDGLKLYYGSNAKVSVDGRLLEVPTNPVPTECAFMMVFLDGENEFAIYIPRCEVMRGDNLEISDTESFASLPLAIRPLQHGSNSYTYAVTPMGGAG